MKYKQKYNELLNKLNNNIIRNQINHSFTDINVLVAKHLIENIDQLEQTKDLKKSLLSKIEMYFSSPQESLLFTKALELTLLSKQIINEIYKDFGFKGCTNFYLIKQYHKENGLNFDLFFNQVDSVEEIQISCESVRSKIDTSKYVPIEANKIDGYSLNIYFDKIIEENLIV